jgi:hypothetical protein
MPAPSDATAFNAPVEEGDGARRCQQRTAPVAARPAAVHPARPHQRHDAEPEQQQAGGNREQPGVVVA